MNSPSRNRTSTPPSAEMGHWDQFWFSPTTPDTVLPIRVLLCLITIAFFVSSWPDIEWWYGSAASLSTDQTATFLTEAGLQRESRWILSPLYLTDNEYVYRGYLAAGMVVALIVLAGRGGRTAGFLLWGLFVGWANRTLMLSSLAETLLSLSLFAVAIAPAWSPMRWFRHASRDAPSSDDSMPGIHWTNRFAERLLVTQITVVGLATFATMLAGRVWWNGLGAYALAAPVEDRTIDWSSSFLAVPLGHDLLTFGLVAALPVGLGLGWLGKRAGIVILVSWSLVVALLGSHWLYAATFATMSLAFTKKHSFR